jgi:hypothetical protein
VQVFWRGLELERVLAKPKEHALAKPKEQVRAPPTAGI